MLDSLWWVENSGTSNQLFAVKTVTPWVGWVAGVGGVVRRTTTAGNTWLAAGTIGTDIYTITAVDASVAIVGTSPSSGAAKLWKTTNGGSSWVVKDSTGVFWDYVHMFDATNGYALGDPPGAGQNWILKRTSDGGETWVNAASLYGGATPEFAWNNAMMWLNQSTGWFGSTANKIYRTSDSGSTWTSAPTPCTSAMHFNALNIGLASSSSGTLNKSTDGGATWQTGPTALPYPIYSLWGGMGTTEFWAVAGNNVYYSSDFGVTWATSGHGYTGSRALNHFNAVRYSNRAYGWACGASGSLVHHVQYIDGIDDPARSVPLSIALHQNYPNPFNPTTTIRYSLAASGRVTLKIVSMLGQEIATLVDGHQVAGEHEVYWDGRVTFGASGVYLVQLTAKTDNGAEFVQQRKMLLLK
jgi:photosystem II stability/assembly factor-like uncharacterized protein